MHRWPADWHLVKVWEAAEAAMENSGTGAILEAELVLTAPALQGLGVSLYGVGGI